MAYLQQTKLKKKKITGLLFNTASASGRKMLPITQTENSNKKKKIKSAEETEIKGRGIRMYSTQWHFL